MPPSPTVFLTTEQIAALRDRIARKVEPTFSAFQVLLTETTAQLDRQPHVPNTWYVPGYYRDAQGHIQAKASLEGDANAAYQLALAYRLTGTEQYAAAAARLALAWATELGELRTPDDSRLSFSYHFPALIIAESLIHGSLSWSAAQADTFRRFLIERALAMNTMERENNWGNWGLVLVLAAAARAGDAALFGQGVARWKEFIANQIAEDGRLPLEVIRNNGVGERGIWYSHFTLMPQTIAAEIARANGVDLYEYTSPNGRTLRQAYERLAPWARDPANFPYFKGSDLSELRGTDYISYFEILNPRWPHPDAAAMLRAMRPLTATHSTPCLTLTHGEAL